jgi:hypothetical protein
MKIKRLVTKKSSMPEEPKHMKELRELIEFMDAIGTIFLTGSQKFEVATEDSDIDYVVKKTTWDTHIYPIIHGHDGLKEEDGSASGIQDPTLHCSCRFGKYNFILTWTDHQFLAWHTATKTISETFGPDELRVKDKRVILFHDIKMAVYNFLENYGRCDI